MKRVNLYTDGACSGNPGPGGYGAILVYGSTEKELSGGEPLTTNNRMELMAAIVGLEAERALRGPPCQRFQISGRRRSKRMACRLAGQQLEKSGPETGPEPRSLEAAAGSA